MSKITIDQMEPGSVTLARQVRNIVQRKESIVAGYNYTVACEMPGNRDNVVLWINKSLSGCKGCRFGRDIKKYADCLNGRQLIIRKRHSIENSE